MKRGKKRTEEKARTIQESFLCNEKSNTEASSALVWFSRGHRTQRDP